MQDLLARAKLTVDQIDVEVDLQAIGDDDMGAARRNTLRQVCELLRTTGGTSLVLHGLIDSAESLDLYVRALPALVERGIVWHCADIGTLTDEMLGVALQVRISAMHTMMSAE